MKQTALPRKKTYYSFSPRTTTSLVHDRTIHKPHFPRYRVARKEKHLRSFRRYLTSDVHFPRRKPDKDGSTWYESDPELGMKRSIRSESQLPSISESVGTSDPPVMETAIVTKEELGTAVIDTCNQECAACYRMSRSAARISLESEATFTLHLSAAFFRRSSIPPFVGDS